MRILTSLFITSLLIAASACGDERSSSEQNSETPPAQLATIRVGIIPIAEVAPIYVGIEKGYFDSEGLKLDLVRMAGGADILPAVGRGDLQVGFTNLVSLALFRTKREGGSDLVAIVGGTYETRSHINHALLVPGNANATPSDLSKVTIAINTRNNIEELMLRRYLRSQGVSLDSLELQAIPFPAMEAALSRNNVGAASIVEPFITNLTARGYKVAARQYLKSPNDTMIVATYAASNKWINANPDIASRFNRAFGRASGFLNDPINETEVRSIIARYTSMDTSIAAKMGLPLMLECIDLRTLDSLLVEIRSNGWLDQNLSATTLLSDKAVRCKQ